MGRQILFIDHDDGCSGSTVSLEYLVSGFRQRGATITVLTPKSATAAASLTARGASIEYLGDHGVANINLGFHFTNLPSLFGWRGVRTVVNNIGKFFLGTWIAWRVIRKTEADLVYVNEYVVLQGAVAAFLAGVPAVTHVRSPFIAGDFGFRRWLLSRLLMWSNRLIVAITPLEAGQIIAHGSERQKILVVGEFVAPPAPGYRTKGESQASSQSLATHVILMLGGVAAIKGTLDFLKAARLLCARRDDVRFVVAGKVYQHEDAESEKYYARCAEEWSAPPLNGRVTVPGHVDEMALLFESADVLVSPSTVSHFARPVIEAWAAGIPIVATRTPHMSALITDGVDGLLVSAGDVSALADCIARLLDDQNLADMLARAGRRRAAEEFDSERNVNRIIDACFSLSASTSSRSTELAA